jgi:hypothetical protein
VGEELGEGADAVARYLACVAVRCREHMRTPALDPAMGWLPAASEDQ